MYVNVMCIFIFLVPGTTCTKEIHCISVRTQVHLYRHKRVLVLGDLKNTKIVNEGQSICNCLLNA